MLPGSGMGGKYEPLSAGELPGAGSSKVAVRADGPIKVGEVHFNSGSAEPRRAARASRARGGRTHPLDGAGAGPGGRLHGQGRRRS